MKERKQDLFTVDDKYYLAHCIASDLGMGAGIALPMQRKFDLREQIVDSGEDTGFPTCILTGRVFNLITKQWSSGKPTYESLEAALKVMLELATEKGVRKIAMPRIGCGLDMLKWAKVKGIVKRLFKDSGIKILVCYL